MTNTYETINNKLYKVTRPQKDYKLLKIGTANEYYYSAFDLPYSTATYTEVPMTPEEIEMRKSVE